MRKVKLEALDNLPITPKTGKSSVIGELPRLPVEGQKIICFYLDDECESPGVSIETNCVEQINNEIKFFDYAKRPFKITLI